MDYSLNFCLRQEWVDRRLQYRPFNNEKTQRIKLGDDVLQNVWLPDVFFPEERRASFHTITAPNRMMYLRDNGTIWYAVKITATLSCNMRLHRYPLDTQNCDLQFESFGYTMEDIILKWLPNPVEFGENIQLCQFSIVDYGLQDCSQSYIAGSFACLRVTFVLKREIGFYMIQMYVPSILIVILSWVGFWISIDAVPARVSIGVTTVLTMTSQSIGSQAQLPKVSYIKAIDVWMFVCLFFVFASLLEFAFVNVLYRKEIRLSVPKRPETQDEEIPLEEIAVVTNDGQDLEESEKRPQWFRTDPDRKLKACYIDNLSRGLFPIAFISFNLIYWLACILG